MRSFSVLFICTENVYRSRFAEALFNHLASERNLRHGAVSRGIFPDASLEDSISPFVEAALRSKGISLQHTSPTKTRLSPADLEKARHIIALNAHEHRPLLAELYPERIERVNFWNVASTQRCEPERALEQIQFGVEELIATLDSGSHRLEESQLGILPFCA